MGKELTMAKVYTPQRQPSYSPSYYPEPPRRSHPRDIILTVLITMILTVGFSLVIMYIKETDVPQQESETVEVTTALKTPDYIYQIERIIREKIGGVLEFNEWKPSKERNLKGLITVTNTFVDERGKTNVYRARVGHGQVYFISVNEKTIFWDEENEDKFVDTWDIN